MMFIHQVNSTAWLVSRLLAIHGMAEARLTTCHQSTKLIMTSFEAYHHHHIGYPHLKPANMAKLNARTENWGSVDNFLSV